MQEFSNISAELMTLSILYTQPDSFAVIDQWIDESHFTLPENKLLFQVFKKIYGDGHTSIGVEHILSAVEALDIDLDKFKSATDNLRYLEKILYNYTEDEDIYLWVEKLQREAYRRNQYQTLRSSAAYLKSTKDNLEEIVNKVESGVLDVAQSCVHEQEGSERIFEGAREFLISLAEDPVKGVDIGLPLWQEGVGELCNGTVHFLCGYTGSGKSQFALRAAMFAAKTMPVLYLDNEMDSGVNIVRGFCMINGINYRYVRKALWNKTDDQLGKMGFEGDQIAEIKKTRIILNDDAYWERFKPIAKNFHYRNINGIPLEKSFKHVRRWLHKNLQDRESSRRADCFVIVDQIKLGSHAELQESGLAEWQYLGIQMSVLHDLAHNLNIPVLCLGQMNEYGGVEGAKRIKNTADSVTFLHKKNLEEFKNHPSGNCKLIIDKARFGSEFNGEPIHIIYQRDRGNIVECGVGDLNSGQQQETTGDSKPTDGPDTGEDGDRPDADANGADGTVSDSQPPW